jgi:hypothetical protein
MLLPPHTHLPERVFEVIQRRDGSETIDLVKQTSAGGAAKIEMKDLAALNVSVPRKRDPERKLPMRTMNTFAVSQVMLDEDGRVTEVRWARVDTAKNAWAEPEAVAPVASVVAALQAGDQVFALFPSIHGHLPERQFVQADYDGGRKTIVLAGPSVYERDIHDMDRVTPARPHRPAHGAHR